MSEPSVTATTVLLVSSGDQIDRIDRHPYPDVPLGEVVAIQFPNGDRASTICLIERYTGNCGSDHFRAYLSDGVRDPQAGDDPCHPGSIIKNFMRRYDLKLPRT